MKYAIAVIVCFLIFFLYHFLGASLLGWKSGGGVIPTIILFAVIGVVWRAITKKRSTPKEP